MNTLLVPLDATLEDALQRFSQDEKAPPGEVAARLIRRALRDVARSRRLDAVDWGAVRASAAEFADEDFALAESDAEMRAALLAREDAA